MTSTPQSALPCWARFRGCLLRIVGRVCFGVGLWASAGTAFAQNTPAPSVFLGSNVGAAFFPETGRGTLLLAADLNAVVDFRVAANGQFSAPFQTGDGRALTVSGTLTENTLTSNVSGLDSTFSAAVQPRTGRAAGLAGLYVPTTTLESRGTAILVAATGDAMVVVDLSRSRESLGGRTVVQQEDSRLSLSSAGLSFGGTFEAVSGTFTGSVASSRTFTVPLHCVSSTIPRTDRVLNVSARGWVTPATGRTLIAGFVVEGQREKRILLRALGPGLGGRDPRATVIANPRLRLFDSSNRLVVDNDDWSGGELSSVFTQVGAFPLTTGSRDAAVLTTLQPGVYTLQVSGETGSGQALAEIYDVDARANQIRPRQIINGSSLGTLNAPQEIMNSGFVVVGNRAKKLLIRAVGPSLATFGVTNTSPDPSLLLTGRSVAFRNDNWSTPLRWNSEAPATGPEIAAAAHEVGAFPLDAESKDAAVLVILAPGDYVVSVTGTTGTVLIEVYELP